MLMRSLASVGLARPFAATCTCDGEELVEEFEEAARAIEECMRLARRAGNAVMEARAVKVSA